MKNQYVGDIGDYTKYGLLRVLEKAQLSLGINWYLTDCDSSNDGEIDGYLKKPCDTPDKELFESLKKIRKNRTIKAVEESGLLKNTKFFSELLAGAHRKSWHECAIEHLRRQEVIFLDPDNGFEIKSVNPNYPEGNKYATYDEAVEYYYKNKSSVIVYQHWRFTPDKTREHVK